MLEGITVLSQKELMITIFPGWLLTLLVVGFISGFVLTIISACSENLVGTALFSAEGLLCVLIMVLSVLLEKPSGAYEYKVTIDESVSFVYLNSHYDVTGQDGKIYTIRLKEEE